MEKSRKDTRKKEGWNSEETGESGYLGDDYERRRDGVLEIEETILDSIYSESGGAKYIHKMNGVDNRRNIYRRKDNN